MHQHTVLAQRYRIDALIGQGAMGKVFRAFDQTLNDRPVAVKVLALTASDQDIKRFHLEAKALAALTHPNIMPVLDFGQADDGQLFLIMEYIEGETLADVIEKRGAQTFLDAVQKIEQICQALRFAHSQSVLHRDIKPSNILLVEGSAKEMRVLLSDFGLAKKVDKDLKLTKQGTTMGTPAYMSPETVLGKETDERSDIYSLGCLIFEVLAGKPPFQTEDAVPTMMAHVNKTPPLLSQVVQNKIDPEVDELVARCLHKEPAERFQTVTELADEIAKIKTILLDRLPGPESSGAWSRSGVYSAKLNSSSRAPYIVAACAVVLLIGFGLVIAFQFIPENRPVQEAPRKQKTETTSRRSGVYILTDSNKISYPLLAGRLSDAQVEAGLAKYPHYIGHVDFENATVSDAVLKRLLVNPKLQIVNFFETPISDQTYDYLAQASDLRIISIQDAGAIAPDNLRKLSRLNRLEALALDLKSSTPETIDALSEIQCVTVLRLQNWHLTRHDVEAIAKLKNMVRIDFKNCVTTAELINQLKQLPKCYSFGFHGTSLHERQTESIAKLPSIQMLILNRVNLSDSAFLKLIKARNLKSLYADVTGVSEDSVDLFKKLLPNAKVIFNPTEAPLHEPERL